MGLSSCKRFENLDSRRHAINANGIAMNGGKQVPIDGGARSLDVQGGQNRHHDLIWDSLAQVRSDHFLSTQLFDRTASTGSCR
jgi:hypothetical protein